MSEVDPQDDAEELEELPPLDPSLDDEREGPDDAELTPLLSPLEEDVDLDQESVEPDVDLGLEVPEESLDRDDGHEVVLDIQSLLSLADEDERPEESESAGPEQLDPAADLSDVDEPIVGSLEEGTDEPLEDLVSEDLPELDADEPGAAENEASWLSSDALRDEELPAQAERPWQVTRHDSAGADLDSLVLAGARVWVAGSELRSFERDGSAGRVELAARVLFLSALGDTVLALTPSGALERVVHGGGARRLTGFRDALSLAPDAPAPLAMTAFPEVGAEAFLVAAGSNRVAITRNAGATFESSEIGGRVGAVSLGAPTRLLVSGVEGAALLDWSGVGFRRTPLDAMAEEAAAGEHVLFGSLRDAVAISSADRGLVVSVDAGRSFARIPGCLHATALCLAERAGRPRVWLAAFVESEERSLVIEVDVTTRAAEIIGELSPGDDVAQSDGDDGRVRALAWDAEHGWLWAAGATGLYRLAPPGWSS